MSILVIAPHPDDEVLGCGGTISKYAKDGNEINLCICTKAYAPDWSEEFLENRPKEIEKATKILGIKKTFFLDFPTVKLDTIPQKELNESIAKVIDKVKPDIVYTPHEGDLNKDHRIVFDASLVALRPLTHNAKRILSYEIPSETEWGRMIEPFIPNVYVDISETFDVKVKAMEAYKSEIKNYPHPRSIKVIEALARIRGSEVGLKSAEAFSLIREIL